MALSDLVHEISRSVPQNAQHKIADIIEFVESSWGLNFPLFPVQRVILKAHYGIALDDNPLGLDLDEKVPLDTPGYADIIDQAGYYKFRVRYSDWRGENLEYLTEAQYLEVLYEEGRSNIRQVIPGVERREMILSLGRRSGKTSVSACIVAYETYKLLSLGNPQRNYGLPKTNTIQLISVATAVDQASLLFQEASGHFQSCSFFAPYIANSTQTGVKFQTAADIEQYGSVRTNPSAKATLKITFRPSKSGGLRGAGNLVVILDEVAFFPDDGLASAQKVYDAVVPSTKAYTPKDPKNLRLALTKVSDARVILISSPMGRQGLFYKQFQMALSASSAADNMLAIQAPTWEVNTTVPFEVFDQEYHKSPVVFRTEYGGEFLDGTRGWIDEPNDLLACVDPKARPVHSGIQGISYFAGLDVALKGDGTAIAIGHLEPNGKIVLDLVDWIKAGEGAYKDTEILMFTDVAEWVYQYSRRFYIRSGMFDQHMGLALDQALKAKGIQMFKMVPSSANRNSEYFQNFKDMMWDKRLVLFDTPVEEGHSHTGYIEELLELQAEQKTKHRVDVEAPRMPGKHDDRSDALVRMVYLATQDIKDQPLIMTGNRQGPYQPNRMPMDMYRKAFQSGSHPSRQIPKPGRPGWSHGPRSR